MNLRAFVAGLLLVLTAPSAFAQDTLSKTQFRDHVIAETQFLNSAHDIDVTGPLSFTIDGGAVNLDSGYAEYLNDPSQLADISRRWVQMFNMMTEGVDVSANNISERLVMLVRSKAYIEGIPADSDPAETPVWRHLAGDVVVMMMADYPTMRSSVTADLLAKGGLSRDDAWQIAFDNSVAAMGGLSIGSYGPGGPVAITAESGLATAILADPGVCSEAGLFADAYVLVVDRDTFVLGRSDDAMALRDFWNFVRGGISNGQFVSKTPLTCKAGKLVEATVPN